MSGFCMGYKMSDPRPSCARFDPVLIQPRPMLESPLRRLSIMTCGIRFLARLSSLVVGAALVLACWPTSLAAQAQATTGVIRGTVSDPSGNVVVGALVTLTDVQTRFQRTVTTNEKGVFVAPLLPLGTYEVRARAVGLGERRQDRKSTRLNSSHGYISYAVFCLKK